MITKTLGRAIEKTGKNTRKNKLRRAIFQPLQNKKPTNKHFIC